MRLGACLVALGLVAGCARMESERAVPFDDYNEWLLDSALEYQIGESEFVVSVPAGFVTDYASIPRAFCQVLPKHGRYSRAGIVHDYLYWKGECSQRQADRIMYLAMEESGVDSKTRGTIYRTLRSFGEAAWKSNAADRQAHLPRILPPEYRTIPGGQSWKEYRAYLREQNVPLDSRSSVPPPYCAAADRLFDEARAEQGAWWQIWRW
jgi:hypothetical protein